MAYPKNRLILLFVITILLLISFFIDYDITKIPKLIWLNNNVNNLNDSNTIILYYGKTVWREPPHLAEEWELFFHLSPYQCTINDALYEVIFTDNITESYSKYKIKHIATILHGIGLWPIKLQNLYNELLHNKTRDNDIYILTYGESAQCHTVLNDSKLLAIFDLLMDYRYNADIPWPYFDVDVLHSLIYDKHNNFSFEIKSNNKPVAVVISNCIYDKNGRHLYVPNLIKYLNINTTNIDSMGNCWRNAGGMNSKGPFSNHSWVARNAKSIEKYKFYICIENTNCDGYITEKLQIAILAGAIPIVFSYKNIPNYNIYLPHHSYINIADFNSSKSLANYILKVANNKTLYNEYFWYKFLNKKKKDLLFNKLRNKYHKIWYDDHRDRICRLANVVWNYKYKNKQRKTIKANHVCAPHSIMQQFL